VSPGWPRRAPVALGALGAIGTTLIASAGVVVGAPGPTGSWIERDVVGLAPRGAVGSVCACIALVVGVVAVLAAWITLGLVLRRGAPLRPLIAISAAWAAPLIVGPPIYSRDVYSYAADGRMVNRHLDPNMSGPAVLGSSRFVAPVSGAWRTTRSPYGPLFLRIAGWSVRVAGNSVLGSVLVLRMVAVCGVALIAAALPTLARAAGKDPARALWLGVCNPLVLVHFIGGAHNDALMIGLIVTALALAAARHPVASLMVCALAAAVKVPALIVAAFVAAEAVRGLPRRRRILALVRLLALTAAAFAAVTWATGLGWGWIGALGVPGMNRSLLTPTTFIAHLAAEIVGHETALLSVTRAVALVLAAAGITYLIWRAPKIGTIRACGIALALVVVLGPVVLPWYALWGVIPLAASGRRIERGYAALASIVLFLMVQPSGSSMPDVMLMSAVLVLGTVAAVVAWHPARNWLRHDLAVAIDDYRAAGRIARLPDLARRAFRGVPLARAAVHASQSS
jgi:alpha-1,6-mannosyltransferase